MLSIILQYAIKQADAVATIGGEVERKAILLCYLTHLFIKLVERI